MHPVASSALQRLNGAVRSTMNRCSREKAIITLILATAIAMGADSFLENWNAASSPYFVARAPSFDRVIFNIPDEAANDSSVVQLKLPANPSPGPGGGAEIDSRSTYLYGQFSTRLKTADCAGQPKAGVVTGYFTYSKDGQDYNGNGLPDNSEIDFEWLGAEPEVVYLTMWTDYRDSDAAQRKVGRAINLKTGRILYTCYFEAFGQCQSLTGGEAEPPAITAMPAYNSATRYYEYGFDWTPTEVTWWMIDPETGQRVILWDYRGPSSRIPARPSFYMTNVWYTPGWYPEGMSDAIQKPTLPVSMFVDWTRYRIRTDQPGKRLRRPRSDEGLRK